MPQPHIVLVTVHDLGRHLGCYGATTVSSPRLDAFASEGVRFARAFATASGCSPARASIATGRHPHSNGVMGLAHPPFWWDLHPGERHMAQLLGDGGYETHLFGFQHVSPYPARLGFQHLHGFDTVGPCKRPAWGRRVSAEVAEFLAAPRGDKPLYMEVNLEEPHRPFDQDGVTPDTSRGVAVPPFLPQDEAAEAEMAAFQGAIARADESVGAILEALDAAGMRENTLVIFIADHGMPMPRAKCTLYDPGIEVAWLMRAPALGVAGGRGVTPLVSQVDVLPTVLEAAGLQVPRWVHGRSTLGLARGEAQEDRPMVFAGKTYHSYYDPMRAVRTERHKLIRNFEAAFAVEVPGDVQEGPTFESHVTAYHAGQHPQVELYDLEADPWETNNLAGDRAHEALQDVLDARLWEWMKATADPLLQGPVPSPAYEKAMAQRPRP